MGVERFRAEGFRLPVKGTGHRIDTPFDILDALIFIAARENSAGMPEQNIETFEFRSIVRERDSIAPYDTCYQM